MKYRDGELQYDGMYIVYTKWKERRQKFEFEFWITFFSFVCANKCYVNRF